MRVAMHSSTSSMPRPTFALMSGASDASRPMISSISWRTSSGRALGRSILLMTGMISRLCSSAMYTLASVCASTPCVASTTSSAPSQAASARETS